jgi:DNA modification methylase
MTMMKIHCKYDEIAQISKLLVHPKNPNQHTPEQIERLAQILKYQGWRYPIKVSKRSGYITSGHGRLMAAVENGWLGVPVNYQDYESDEQEYADLVSDNSIADWSELNLAQINFEVPNLGPDFDIDLLGIKDFVLEPADKLEPQCDEDEAPEVSKESHVKPGDVYRLGRHRLMCGDSTNIQHVETLMNGEKADMVFTDPPYGVSYQSNMRTKSDKFDVIANDEVFLTEWVGVLPIVSEGWVFVWTTWRVLTRWLEITAPIGSLTNMIIWDKGGGGIGDLEKTFSTDYEIALVFNRGAKITGKRLGSVWSIGKDKAKDYVHPTQKPVELAQTALENCTQLNDSVLDLFGGSGSTLIACEKTNRQCFMMELDPNYCSVILDRWSKYTGKDPIRDDGKKWSEIKISAIEEVTQE